MAEVAARSADCVGVGRRLPATVVSEHASSESLPHADDEQAGRERKGTEANATHEEVLRRKETYVWSKCGEVDLETSSRHQVNP